MTDDTDDFPLKYVSETDDPLMVHWKQDPNNAEIADYHIITTEQIREAWELVEWHRTRGAVISARDMERALEKLGIVRCEGCKGTGRNAWGSVSTSTCTGCNGEGFKIGGEDE